MARGKLTKEEIDVLKKSPYVSDADENRVIYTNDFKFHFMKEYLSGKKPQQIFREAGFEPTMLGSKRIERAAHRWRESYAAGSLGSYQDGTIRKRRKTLEQLRMNFQYEDYLGLLESQQSQIERLKVENELLRQKIAQM